MRIDFFETNNGMDTRAVGAGVYMIELENRITKNKVCLYIGESVWIASRCGVHLYSLYENPSYFGLEKDDIENDDFILKFSVVETIDDKKSVLGCGQYKELELGGQAGDDVQKENDIKENESELENEKEKGTSMRKKAPWERRMAS